MTGEIELESDRAFGEIKAFSGSDAGAVNDLTLPTESLSPRSETRGQRSHRITEPLKAPNPLNAQGERVSENDWRNRIGVG